MRSGEVKCQQFQNWEFKSSILCWEVMNEESKTTKKTTMPMIHNADKVTGKSLGKGAVTKPNQVFSQTQTRLWKRITRDHCVPLKNGWFLFTSDTMSHVLVSQ